MPAEAGIVGSVELNTGGGGKTSIFSSPNTWSWIWFGVAVAIVLGYHLRIGGIRIPPSAG